MYYNRIHSFSWKDKNMEKETFLVVNAKVLPNVFEKVVEAKELLSEKKVKNVTEAIKAVGISRSAFYKYRDSVYKFNLAAESTVTLKASLSDKAGVFSELTKTLFENGANIVTANQSSPKNGVASVTITIDTNNLTVSVDGLIKKLMEKGGIISVRKE